ncbi:eukaryotic translation initiation factor 2 subunit 2-like [Tubulanus polymorphus]|uniref:eukaryotic translation initiation factor 2 subunit 2-like n=1 Tax=Tubulanus polymorphus TaxID=672921 RepID=UPI003DA46352
MAEDELSFDTSMKKKKKKKMTFDPNLIVDAENTPPAETNVEKPEKEEAENKDDDDLNLDEFDFSKTKKKKKAKKKFDMDDMKEAVEEAEKEDAPVSVDVDDAADIGDDLDLDLGFKGEKKKKKKGKNKKIDVILSEKPDSEQNEEDESGEAWANTDRDYTYDELLQRVFDIMREKNPDILAGEKKRLVMKPPQVMRVGTRRTAFVNFTELCKMLHRQPKHLLAFLLAELGTSGSVDGNNQLIIKGRFQAKQIENVLRRYIKEYVTCHTCRSPDTILQKDTRLFFLQCETCGSRCSVASIKSGFQAVTGKRAAIRAKTT